MDQPSNWLIGVCFVLSLPSWFVVTPNPVSLIQYAVLSWYVSHKLLKTVSYKRFPRLISLIDGFFIVAFFVVIGDTFWAGFCALKFVPMFPQDLDQILISVFRDVTSIIFFYLVMERGSVHFNKRVKLGLLIMAISQALWFLLAPSPAYTDYAFALRHGFPLGHVIPAFILSHFLMRLPLWFVIVSAVQIEDNSINI